MENVGYFQYRTVDSIQYDLFEVIPNKKFVFYENNDKNNVSYYLEFDVPISGAGGWSGFIASKRPKSWSVYLSSSVFFADFINDITPFINTTTNTIHRLYWQECAEKEPQCITANVRVDLPPQYLSKLIERKEYGKLFL